MTEKKADGGNGAEAGPATPERALEAEVGRQVKEFRQSLGMTIADLARATSLSPGMLSKLENGQTSPSLATLQALAGALNIPLTALFATYDEKRDATFVKSGHGLTIERRGTRAGHVYQLLGHSLRGSIQVEPYLITLDQRSDAFPIFRHPGYEFIYMLDGELLYRHADKTYRLEPGDSLFFDADAPHGPQELRRLPATYLSIIVTPMKA